MAVLLLVGVVAGDAFAQTPDTTTAPAFDPRVREGRWAVGPLAGSGRAISEDLDRHVDFTNLALASGVPYLREYWIAGGALRYGISERWAFDLRAGYLWRSLDGGLVERRVSAIPLVAGVTAHPWRWNRIRFGPYVGAGVLYEAKFSGQDPLGGVNFSGTGWLAEAGVEAEYPLFGPSGTVRARGGGQLARVSEMIASDLDFTLDGFVAQVGIFYYLKP